MKKTPIFTLHNELSNLFVFCKLSPFIEPIECIIEGEDGTQLPCRVRFVAKYIEPNTTSVLFYRDPYSDRLIQVIPLTEEGKKQIVDWYNGTYENPVKNTLFPDEYYCTTLPEDWDVLPEQSLTFGYVEDEKNISGITIEGEFFPM